MIIYGATSCITKTYGFFAIRIEKWLEKSESDELEDAREPG
jgi:hypothetical protein